MSTQTVPSVKHELLDVLEQEYEITLRVLRAFPEDRLELRPHPKSKSARELVELFAWEPAFAAQGLTGSLDWSAPGEAPPEVVTLEALLGELQEGHHRLMHQLRGMSEEQLHETIPFPVAPGRMESIPKYKFLWALVSDQIHHRGQLSVYLRLADARVPSIYGPSADEPW